MIFVKRPELADPPGLALRHRSAIARQVLIDTFAKCLKPQVDDTLYKAYKDYLLAAFADKCAYCESVISASQPGDVEHYRPKNRVTDDSLTPLKANYDGWGEIDHPGYFWLAYEWENLLPSCAECNRYRSPPSGHAYGKADRFPIKGKRAHFPGDEAREKALLLDPTTEEPNKHFLFFEDGKMRALTSEGEATIKLLGLNTRELLVRMRRKQYLAAWTALGEYINLARGQDEAQIEMMRLEVNDIWEGRDAHTAFGRLAIAKVRTNYARMGWQMPMPIPPLVPVEG